MWLYKLIPTQLFSAQLRKPSGFVGRFLMAKILSDGNAEINGFVKECLTLQPHDHVLEVGFGPGQLISEIAQTVTNGHIEGIDFSDVMLQKASKTNAKHIASGLVKLHEGECRTLPFANNTFDKVCAVNTIYFWDKPEEYLAEIYRVIKPGGKLVIGFRDETQMRDFNLSQDVFSLFSLKAILELLSNAGFSEVHIKEQEGTHLVSYSGIGCK